MNTPITWVPALATTSRHASIVSRISSGVRPIELTESSTGDCRSAETSALKVNRSGSPTLVRSDPTITRICGLISAFVSMNLETICWRALSLSRRASCSVTPTACSRVCSTLTTERSASVRFSSACTAGRNMLVFAVWASISTTPNATTFPAVSRFGTDDAHVFEAHDDSFEIDDLPDVRLRCARRPL